MFKNLSISFFTFTSVIIYAQDTINGKLYGKHRVAMYVKVSNTIKNTSTISDENGDFSLKASVGDAIVFSSFLYEDKYVTINNSHFSEVFVIQLKDKINQLDEIVLNEIISEKPFDPKTYHKELSILIKNDRKKHPWKYRPVSSFSQGADFVGGFLYLTNKLFPKKEKKKKKNIYYGNITYLDLKELNHNDDFFSDKFFVEELNIPVDLKLIFFDYVAEQNISSRLLNIENRLLLTEQFFKLSDKFKVIIKDGKPIND